MSTLIPAPITSLGLDGTGASLAKGWEKIIIDGVNSVTDFIPQALKKRDFGKFKNQTMPVYSGLPSATAWDGMSTIAPQGIGKLYNVTVTQSTYGLSTEYTWESDTWDAYGIVGDKKAFNLGVGLQHKRQLLFADYLNAFDVTAWSDGVSILNANHPYDTRYSASGVQSNLAGGALSITTLRAAIQAGMNFKDPMGRPMTQTPYKLWVHTSKVSEALEVLNVGMNLKSGTGNNDRNPFGGMGLSESSVVGYPYFDHTNSWLLWFSQPEFYYVERVPITIMPAEKTPSHGLKQDGIFSLGFYAESWRGVMGYLG